MAELEDVKGESGRAMSWRAIILGLLGVAFVSLLAPFNNYVVNNTDLIGNHLPIGVLLFFSFVCVLINGVLSARTNWALTRGELAVALAMTLVGCALPSVGLMRYLPGYIVGPLYHSTTNFEIAELMRKLNFPDWIYPTMTPTDPAARGNDPVVREYYMSAMVESRTVWGRLMAVPWAAWVTPAISWGIFFGAAFTGILTISLILRRQWVENERLSFPLSTIYLSLIDPPEKGRWVNELFRSRAFWIAALSVLAIHTLGGMNVYWSKYFPSIPLSFDLRSVLANPPWTTVDWEFKEQRIFFTIIGITYFIRSTLAFSLWFFFLLIQVAKMINGSAQQEWTTAMEADQTIGAIVPFAVAILFVGRHHVMTVLRQMFRGERRGEAVGAYISYRVLGWLLVACITVMGIWLKVVGTTLAGAICLPIMMMLVSLVVMRVVSETGLLYVLLPLSFQRLWIYLANDLPSGLTVRTSPQTFFISAQMFGMQSHDTREALAGFAPNAWRVADNGAQFDHGPRTHSRRLFFLCLILAMAFGYFLSGASSIWTKYNYAYTLDSSNTRVGEWGTTSSVRDLALNPSVSFANGNPPTESHNRLLHVGIGAGVTTLLSVLRLRIAGWPFDPIGFLLVYSWGLKQIWVSVFLGWLLKVLLLRLGGSQLFRSARPVCLGLILGECAAAAMWLVVSFILAMRGMEFYPIRLLPF